MNIEELSDSEIRVENWRDVDELLTFRDGLRAAQPGRQTLFILDNQDQAGYTSFHATGQLWLTGEEDATEHSAIMIAWIQSQLADATLDLEHKLKTVDENSLNLLRSLHNLGEVFRTPLQCLVVESTDPSMAIAAMPNGYFNRDLTPAQNYLLAEQLRTEFGLEIFGLGAQHAAFCRADTLSLTESIAIVDSLRNLYQDVTDEVAADWAAKTAGRRWFLLSYRGE